MSWREENKRISLNIVIIKYNKCVASRAEGREKGAWTSHGTGLEFLTEELWKHKRRQTTEKEERGPGLDYFMLG